MNDRLDRRFASLLVLTVLANMGMGVVMPVLPLYFEQHDVSVASLGLPFVTLVAGRLASRAGVARIIERFGHRRVVMTAFLIYTVVFFLYLAAGTLRVFAALRFGEGIVEGVLAVALNDLAIAYTKGSVAEARVRAMGRFSAAFGVGFLLGPLAGSAVAYLWGLPAIFVAAGVLGLGAVLLTARFIVDAPAATGSAATTERLVGVGVLMGLYSPQFLRRLVFFSLMILLPLHAHDRLQLTPEAVGLFFSASAVITTAIMPFAAIVAKRVGAERGMRAGLLAMIATLALFPVPETVAGFATLFFVETLAFALMLPPAMSIFGDAIDNQAKRTQLLGLMAFVTEIVSLPLAAILPACYAASPAAAWSVVAALAAAALAAFVGARRRLMQTMLTSATVDAASGVPAVSRIGR
ncbi:MAG: MFS transporter [Sulfurifustis sp.]